MPKHITFEKDANNKLDLKSVPMKTSKIQKESEIQNETKLKDRRARLDHFENFIEQVRELDQLDNIRFIVRDNDGVFADKISSSLDPYLETLIRKDVHWMNRNISRIKFFGPSFTPPAPEISYECSSEKYPNLSNFDIVYLDFTDLNTPRFTNQVESSIHILQQVISITTEIFALSCYSTKEDMYVELEDDGYTEVYSDSIPSQDFPNLFLVTKIFRRNSDDSDDDE